MDILFPAYYRDFQCLAAECPDSCCKEWTVDIDPKSAAYYRSLPGDLGDRLRSVLKDTDDGTIMEIEHGRCPMWQQDGLCRIHAELGHNALSKTCREYPRLTHDYGNFVELGLELSCPEAARLILSSKSQEIVIEKQPGDNAPEYDTEVMAILQRSRQEVLSFLDNSPYSLPETLAAILIYAHSVQAELDGAEAVPFVPEACLQDAQDYAHDGDIDALRTLFLELEILTETWRNRLLAPWNPIQWLPQIRLLARYMINRYWLQAVSDYDLICRVKLVIASCILVAHLGGDVIESAQLFSKEIENDPDNVEALLDSAYTRTALTDTNLLGLLLNL